MALSRFKEENQLRLYHKKWTLYDFVFDILFIMIFCVIAFRADTIGADTISYLQKYLSINNSSSYAEYGGFRQGEPLYYYLNRILYLVFGSWNRSIIILEGIVVTWAFRKTIKKYSIDEYVSLLGFMSFGLFLASLCLLRQFLAISICLVSLQFAFNKKRLMFYILVLIAAMFHYSALIFLVAYFVCSVMKCNNKNIVLLSAISFISIMFVDYIQKFFSSFFTRWKVYDSIETGAGGYISFTIFLLITIFVTIYKDTIIKNNEYGAAFLNLNYIHMAIWGLRLITRNAERITLYFTIAPIILLPMCFQAIEERHGRKYALLFRAIVIFLMTAFFIYKARNGRHYFPYKMFF